MSSRPSFDDVKGEASRLADTAKDKAADAVEEIKVASNQLVDKVRELIEEGNVRRISLRKGEKTLIEIPLTVGAGFGAAAILLNPVLAAVGAAAALVADVTLEVERDPEAVTKQAADKAVGKLTKGHDDVENANDASGDASEADAAPKTMGRPADDE